MTTRRLCLLRHGEAAADGPRAGGDADRPLTAKGATDAAAVGRWLSSTGTSLDAVVVSPALRTRQTWEHLSSAWPGSPAAALDPRLYRNTLDDYLAVLRDTDDGVSTLLVVGHNPSVSGLAAVLTDAAGVPADTDAAGVPADTDAGLPPDFPPGGLAVLDLAGDWWAAGPGVATVHAFVAPPR